MPSFPMEQITPPSSGAVIRACLVGLPVGLVVIGALSLALCGDNPHQTGQSSSATRVTHPMHLDPDLASTVRRHVETLATETGPRSFEKFPQLEAARFYLLSTLGPSNLGYTVREQTYAVQGKTFSNVEAELTGRRWPREIIVVGAHYDTISTT
ncbi:MAG: hypothetical protein ABL994_23150, partial [Verrucomicrobiales bacterium]